MRCFDAAFGLNCDSSGLRRSAGWPAPPSLISRAIRVAGHRASSGPRLRPRVSAHPYAHASTQ